MINKQNFMKVKKAMDDYDSQREKVIIQSRVVLKQSKQLIYAVHRDDPKEASILAKKIKAEVKTLSTLANTTKLLSEGSLRVAIQEYVEAIGYYQYVKDNTIIPYTPEFINVSNYLSGLCDLTGELTRRAVNKAAKGNFKETEKAREAVEDIFSYFLQLDIRENDLRRKFDSVKYDLKKLEDLLCELSIKGKV